MLYGHSFGILGKAFFHQKTTMPRNHYWPLLRFDYILHLDFPPVINKYWSEALEAAGE